MPVANLRKRRKWPTTGGRTVNRFRILGLVGMLGLVAALAAPTLAANTLGSRQVTIQLTFDAGGGPETFIASGPNVCASGTTDLDIWFMEFDDNFSLRIAKRLICDDGSGTFTILLSAGGPADSGKKWGGWAIMYGSGVYEHAVGGGTVTGTGRYPKDLFGSDIMTGTITL